MITRDRVFIEGTSMANMVEQHINNKYEGRWNLTILTPKRLSATASASSVFAIITWLETYCGAKTYDLTVASSPDEVWSVSLEERIEDVD